MTYRNSRFIADFNGWSVTWTTVIFRTILKKWQKNCPVLRILIPSSKRRRIYRVSYTEWRRTAVEKQMCTIIVGFWALFNRYVRNLPEFNTFWPMLPWLSFNNSGYVTKKIIALFEWFTANFNVWSVTWATVIYRRKFPKNSKKTVHFYEFWSIARKEERYIGSHIQSGDVRLLRNKCVLLLLDFELVFNQCVRYLPKFNGFWPRRPWLSFNNSGFCHWKKFIYSQF